MAAATDRPVILPLSNPTANTEAVPEDILAWTGGRAIIATGSPFPPVMYGGVEHMSGQANNVFIFPGVGLGAIVAQAREVTDEFFLIAADCLAAQVTAERFAAGAVYPPVSALRAVSHAIGCAIVRYARDQGLGRAIPEERVESVVDAAMWWPAYAPYEPV